MIFRYLPFITLKGYNHMIPYGSTRGDLDVWIGLGHLRFGMQNIKSKTKAIKRSRIFHIFHILQIRIYRHKVPHEAVVSHSVQVVFPSKKVFPCLLTSLFAGWCSSNGDMLMIFCCYVRFASIKWKIIQNMTKKYKKRKTFQNIPHIPDVYRLCLYKIENDVKHYQKKLKTFQNIPHRPDTGYASITSVIWLNFGYPEAFGCIL